MTLVTGRTSTSWATVFVAIGLLPSWAFIPDLTDRILLLFRRRGQGEPQRGAGPLEPAVDRCCGRVQFGPPHVQATRRAAGADLGEDGHEMDVDRERVAEAAAGHDCDRGDAVELAGVELVEEELEQSGVGRLVRGRGDHQRTRA